MPKLIFSDAAELKAMRKKLGMNQKDFWERVGITQSGGSRYESGRGIPESVRLLVHLTYAPPARSQRLFDVLRGWKQS
ncbi:helix-turn-helix domain-containing protein [Aromatoleum bremense]|uniref:Helix-turn-helix domain-containing protein n=1 Tax=Aromatoleum bremense TaxID=76115 RepID=A0ABX1P0W8_9RHOO|nr:helix-turn-helix domain-containing protein [Aromatoleum bremense]NMG17688.1 helix-turn-helix domain-containing protein [Aromatoleum bremense]